MGAWDAGSFSNDDALDFVADVKSIDDIKHPFAELGTVSDETIDSGLACEALAAADLIAGMLGRPASDMPEDAEEILRRLGEPTAGLLEEASKVVRRVLENSELAELWREADFDEWQTAVRDLLERLDPETPYDQREAPEELQGGFVCSVCSNAIPDDERINIEIFYPDMPGVSMGVYLHQACVEENFKAPHYNADGSPHDDLVVQVKAYLDQK